MIRNPSSSRIAETVPSASASCPRPGISTSIGPSPSSKYGTARPSGSKMLFWVTVIRSAGVGATSGSRSVQEHPNRPWRSESGNLLSARNSRRRALPRDRSRLREHDRADAVCGNARSVLIRADHGAVSRLRSSRSSHPPPSCSPVSTETGVAQHASPRHASIPSRTAKPAITSAAIASAHAQPSRLFRSRPIRSAAER